MAAAQLAPAEATNAYGVAFRDYSLLETPRQIGVRAFYTEQHAKQTYAFVQAQHAKHLGLQRREMSIWEAAGASPAALADADSRLVPHGALTPARRAHPELLNEVVDDSDPDLDLPQVRGRAAAAWRRGEDSARTLDTSLTCAAQIQHLLQTAEACRAAYPDEDWLHLTAFIHGAPARAETRWQALTP